MNCVEQNTLLHIKIWRFTKDESCEYLEDETSRNWVPIGTGKYDTGSGKIHHRDKMAERVDNTLKELDKMFRVEQYKLGQVGKQEYFFF